MLRLNRPARIAAATAFAGIALAGCANKDVLAGDSGHKTHTVRMTVSSSIFGAALTYRVGHSTPVTVVSSTGCTASVTNAQPSGSSTTCIARQNQTRFAARTVTVRSGAHVSVTGGARVNAGGVTVASSGGGPIPSTDTFTCTIAVDGVVRTSQSTVKPFGAPVPTCTAQGYVGERPFQLARLLEYLAVGVCLLIIVIGLVIQLTPQRHRA